MPVLRVDGNDVFAVYDATLKARELIRTQGRPVMIEAMSYRQGHHSTSDDSTRYRAISEIKAWQSTSCPISRLSKWLVVRPQDQMSCVDVSWKPSFTGREMYGSLEKRSCPARSSSPRDENACVI